MNLDFCPNKASKEFKEMSSVFGEDKAYFLWMRNNGNHLEKAPNGADSRLFEDLLLYFKGDRVQALRVKSKIYRNNFLNWFGDWLNNPETASKIVDENGEPLVVFHGTNKVFSEFKFGSPDATGGGYYTDPKTGEKIYSDSTYVDFFTTKKGVAASYAFLSNNNAFLKTIGIAESLIDGMRFDWENGFNNPPTKVTFGNTDRLDALTNKTGVEAIYDGLTQLSNLEPLSEYKDNILKSIEWIKNKINSGLRISGSANIKAVEKIKQLIVLCRHKLNAIYNPNIFGSIADWYHVLYETQSILRKYNNPEGIKKLKSGEIPRQLIDEWKEKPISSIEDARNKLRKESYAGEAEKLFWDDLSHQWRVKYEEGDVEGGLYSGKVASFNDGYYIGYHPEKGVWVLDMNARKVYVLTEIDEPTIGRLLDGILHAVKIQAEEYNKRDEVKMLSNGAQIYPTFLNIKNPLEHDYESTAQGQGYKDNKKIPFGYVAARQVRKAMMDGNDGVIYKNIQDPYMADNYGVFNNSQIKHINNDGNFSNPKDIYSHIDKNRTLNNIKDYIQNYIKNVYGTGHSSEEIRNKVHELEKELGVVGIAVNNKKLDFSQLHFVGDPIQRDELIRRLQGEDVLAGVTTLVNSINRLFPKLDIKVVEDNSLLQGDAYYDKSTNTIHYSPVKSGQQKSVDVLNIVEECLHPLIACIAATDEKLFNKLLEEASKYTGLVSYIKQAYKNKPEGVINQEIVTQAVARMYANNTYNNLLSLDEFQRKEHNRRFKGIISTIIEWVNKIKSLIVGNKLEVKNSDFSDVISSLDSLIDILNTVGIEFTEVDSNSMIENMQHISNEEIAQSAYELAEQIDAERDAYINDVLNQYNANYPDTTAEQINSVRNKARIQFNKDKLVQIKSQPDQSEAKNIIIAALSSEDLHNAEGIQPILDRINGEYSSSKYLTEKDKDVFRQIKQGTKTRLRSQFSRTIKKTRLIDSIKNQLGIINSRDEDSIDDVFDTIEDFLQRAELEIGRTATYIKSELGDDLSKWDPQQINYIRQDLIGYYEGLLKSIKGLFNGNSAVAEANKIRREDPAAMDLEAEVNQLYNDIVNLQEDYQSTVVMPYAEKVLVDFVNDSDIIENKEQFIKNMKTWLYQDTAYGDLAAGEVVIGMASRSRSPIVRIIEKMMSDTEFERNRRVLKKGKELIKLYNKIRPVGSQISFSNFQKMFMELDGEDGTTGNPTSYFVRDRNYGRFYKEKDEFEQKLRDKYADKGVTWEVNEYSGLIDTHFPEEDHTADNSVYNQYYDELDEWLDKHCERRYTLEYYKKKRRFLSPAALEAQSMIQHQIDILCLKAMTEDGWVDSNKLEPHERQKLKELRKQKRELACPYIFRNNTDNIIVLEKKVGDEARIADEISRWNKYIEKHVKYKENKEKFEAALAKYPEGSMERRRFLADNYILRINPELFEAMSAWWIGIFEGYGEEYEKLQNRHRAILNHLKQVDGYADPNLDLIGTGLNQDTSVWQELKYLEQEMANIRRDYEAEHGKSVSSNADEGEEIPQFITSKLVMTDKDNKTMYDYLRQLYINHPGLQQKNLDEFTKLFTYIDHKGTVCALKAFSTIAPVADTFKINPLDDTEPEKPSFIHTYSSLFSELDESSDFVNSKWKKELKTSLQPKVRRPGTHRRAGEIDYTNDQYNKIMSNEGYKKFYEALMSTMDEANSMIPTRATERSYLMPQITARGMLMLGRSRSILDLLTALGYMFQDVFTAKFAEKDGDVSTNWDLPRRPDGTVVNNIPIRFVKRLENPALVSSDVVGSVMLFYDMATNYSLKSENLPALELMKEAINPERSTGAHKLGRQYEKVSNLLDFRYYGKEDVIGDDTSKAPSELNKKATTLGKKFRSLASMSMLAINFTTIEVGYIDALMSSIADAVGGKYFTKGDLMYGYGLALRHLPYIIANIGNPATSDWLIAAMLYNLLSRSNSEIFDRTDQSRFRKALNQVRMGGYTMADYLINTMILGATYHHYRLVDSPDGSSKKFMSKSDAIREYTKLGYTEKQAVSKWENSKTTLKEAYYVEDGLFTIKPEYKLYINKKLENQIAGRLRDRTAVYNGVIPTVEKAKVQLNVWGSYLTLMRNFYVNTYWERAQSGYDVAAEEEILSSKLGMRTADNGGYVNFETGETGNGLWWSFLKGLYKYVVNVKHLVDGKDMRQLTRDQRYAMKRILSEIVMIAGAAKLMILSITFARSNDDDDKDPTWTINLFDPEGEDRPWLQYNSKNHDKKFMNWLRWKLALLSTRTFTERSTFYWPGTVTELLTSPSTAKSYLDDLGYNLELFMDLFEINGHDNQEIVKTGGYRGMTRGTRDVLKITGFTGIDNLVRGWHTSGIKSTLNWYGNVSPNNFLVPSKSAWLEEQGLNKKGNKKNSKKKSAAY